jgi:uncharacterized OB-fold protein/acyl dehydratase
MAWNKPLPQVTEISAPFWDGLRAHTVRIQQCDQNHWIFFPRTHCPHCGSRSLQWRSVSGAGTLYSFTVARVPTLPEFTDEIPQLLAVVELAEGVHINTTLVGMAPSDIRIGQAVRPVFDERPGSQVLLRYTAVDSDAPSVLRADTQAEPTPPPAPARAVARRSISCKDSAAMQSLVSETFSDWSNQIEVSQALIDQFAALSGDDYWIHTDPAKARTDSPFGTTIAQGSLVQVLISRLQLPLDYDITGSNNMVNYGSDRLRFANPVPSGCRIHARYRVKAVQAVKSGMQLTMEINIHVVGQERPSVINDLVILYM